MLIKAKALKGYSLAGLDGDIGSISEFFFDDRYWAIRYLVANTGTWLTGRKVLLSSPPKGGSLRTDRAGDRGDREEAHSCCPYSRLRKQMGARAQKAEWVGLYSSDASTGWCFVCTHDSALRHPGNIAPAC